MSLPSSGLKNKPSKKTNTEQLCLLPASCWFLLGLFFDLEDGGTIFS
jgi:hypothetical protein